MLISNHMLYTHNNVLKQLSVTITTRDNNIEVKYNTFFLL